MPPKAKISKKMILDTVLDITREEGFEAVNARGIAVRLQCSTRPIFTCYENMDELKQEFLDYAYDFYCQFVDDYGKSADVGEYLIFPLSYIEFAQEETQLFKLLFISDMDLKMAEAEDFYREIDNEKRARVFAESIGVELERAKVIFLDLFLYTHGIAVLTATKKVSLDKARVRDMLTNVLAAFVGREQWDGNSREGA